MADLPDVPIHPLRRLARGLLFDRHGAEDVVQEAWLAALRAPNVEARLGGWLSEAVKRLARNRRREATRREAREKAAARPEALPGADEHAARLEVLRHLLDALDRLEEPYRRAVMLRYLDDLPPREIARRLGLPVNTARTHVRRGLERLRRDLDGERGRGRQELLAALVPFAGPLPWSLVLGGPSAVVAKTGVLAMKHPALSLVSLSLLLGSFWLARTGVTGAVPPPRTTEPSALRATSAELEPTAASIAPAPRSVVSGAREPLDATASPAVRGSWSVEGYVLRGGRQPASGARLIGRIFAGTKPEGTPLVEASFEADGEGRFLWNLEPPTGLVTVQVAATEPSVLDSSTWDVFLPGDAPPRGWELRLFPLDVLVQGTVRASGGHPVAGARVVAYRETRPRVALTNAEGRFSLACSSIFHSDLVVLAEGYATTRAAELPPSSPGTDLDVVLVPEQRRTGLVVDEQDAPIEGVRLGTMFPFELAEVHSDAQGRFELRGLGVSEPRPLLSVRKDGYASAWTELPPVTEELTIVLRRGVTIAGRVLNPDGQPVPGTRVSVGYGVQPRVDTYSDEEGRFELGPVSADTAPLWAWRVGFAQLRHDVPLPEGTSRIDDLELRLSEPHFLGGVVLDEDGSPVPHAMVWAGDAESESGRLAGFAQHADAAGRFRFEGLPDVPVQLTVLEKGRAALRETTDPLDRDDVVLRLTGPAVLSGRVLDEESGAPIPSFTLRVARGEDPDAWLELGDAGRVVSSPAGEWRLEDPKLRIGSSFQIVITAPGHAQAVTRAVAAFPADPGACQVRLPRSSGVRGRVVDRESQEPVVGARVSRSTALNNGLQLPTYATTTDANGEFRLDGLPLGRTSLHVVAPDGRGTVDGPYTTVAGKTLERWIEIGGNGRVTGRLLDGSGEGLAGEEVAAWAWDALERRFPVATTGGDGGFVLEDVPPGTWTVAWVRRQGEISVQDLQTRVVVTPDEETRTELRAGGRATLRGTLAFPGHALPSVVPVRLFPQPGGGGRDLRGALARDGSFELPGVLAGSWVVIAYPGDGIDSARVDVEVPEEGLVEVEVPLTTE